MGLLIIQRLRKSSPFHPRKERGPAGKWERKRAMEKNPEQTVQEAARKRKGRRDHV